MSKSNYVLIVKLEPNLEQPFILNKPSERDKLFEYILYDFDVGSDYTIRVEKWSDLEIERALIEDMLEWSNYEGPDKTVEMSNRLKEINNILKSENK